MKVLIVEDNARKREELRGFVAAVVKDVEIREAHSFQSGIRSLQENPPDLLLLDMTMPTFDRGPGESGGRMRAYAGRDLLREVSRRGLAVRAIVVTGFESFGDGEERRTLRELNDELQREFGGEVLGTVHVSAGGPDWRPALRAHIEIVVRRKPR